MLSFFCEVERLLIHFWWGRTGWHGSYFFTINGFYTVWDSAFTHFISLGGFHILRHFIRKVLGARARVRIFEAGGEAGEGEAGFGRGGRGGAIKSHTGSWLLMEESISDLQNGSIRRLCWEGGTKKNCYLQRSPNLALTVFLIPNLNLRYVEPK